MNVIIIIAKSIVDAHFGHKRMIFSFDLDNGDGLTNWMQSVQVVSVCLKKGGAGVKREF